MAFLSNTSLVRLLRGVLVYYAAAIVLTSIQLSGSQSPETLTTNASNETEIDPSCISVSGPKECVELPAVCITCDFFDQDGLPRCNYNQNATFSCWPLHEAQCEVCVCGKLVIDLL